MASSYVRDGCESWTLRKNEEKRLEAFETKGLRRILRVSWTAKKTNEWVVNRAGITRELLDFVKARKPAYYGHMMRKQGNYPGKETMQGTMPGRCRRGRPRTAWINNISTWSKLSAEDQSECQTTEINGVKVRHAWCVANPRTKKGWWAEPYNWTKLVVLMYMIPSLTDGQTDRQTVQVCYCQ